MKQRRGFTLVEILVVICIIIMLAGILFPVVLGVKKRANQAKCLAQMRQLGMAVQMYATDNDEVYPLGGYDELDVKTNKIVRHNWQDIMLANNYIRSSEILSCPSAKTNHYLYSYGCNRWVMGWMHSAVVDAVPRPGNTVLMTEKTGYDWVAWEPTAKDNNPFYFPLEPRHNNQLNVLFCDGHVRSVATGHLIMGPDIIWNF